MRLAIGTAHRACSLALIDGPNPVRSRHEIIGRGHAERLVPMIADLLGDVRPDEIVVEVGPGSFTGMRVGIAAARALGLAWNVPVEGVTSTELLAARALRDHPELESVAAILDGGRGEVFLQEFVRGRGATAPAVAVPAGEAAVASEAAIGTGTPLVALPDHVRILGADMPDVADFAAIDAETRTPLPPTPLYVRAPDAKPPAT